MTPLNSIKKVWPKYITGFFFIILLGAYANIFAIGSPYQPGSTLDPACTPGETNCIVQIIPSQTSNANKYLTTDGTSTSWSSSTLVLGGNFTTSGAYATTLTTTGTTTLTLPTTGTLATTSNINTAVSGTTNYIPKFTGTNTIGNSIIFDDGTNVGVGTGTPGAKLGIVGTQGVINTTIRQLGTVNIYDDTAVAVDVGAVLTLGGKYNSAGTYSVFGAIKSGKTVATDGWADGYLSFYTTANTGILSEKMRISSAGNVGIGTASPTEKLEVVGNIKSSGGSRPNLIIDGTDGGQIKFTTAGANKWDIYNTTSGNDLILYGYTGTAFSLYTNAVQRLTIDSSGNLSVSDLSGSGNRCVYADATGQLNVKNDDCGLASGGDDMGDHTATQNIILGSNWLSGDGGNEGIKIDANGDVNIQNGSTPTLNLTSAGGNAVAINDVNGFGLWFKQASSTKMVINSSGNVGIGTTSPGYKLEVTTSASATYTSLIKNTSATGYGLNISAGSTSTSSYPFVVDNQATNLFAIRGDGNVGIGTASPGSLLNVYSTNNALPIVALFGTANSVTLPYASYNSQLNSAIQIAGSAISGQGGPGILINNTTASGNLIADTSIGTVAFMAGSTAAAEKRGAIISGGIESNSATNMNAYLAFYTNNAGTIGERMRINAAGNVGIGTASPNAPLHVFTETDTSSGYGSFMVGSSASGEMRLSVGTNDAGGYTYIQSTESSTGHAILSLNPSGGNVGIGTTTPGAKLDIAGAGATADTLMLRFSNASNPAYYWDMWRDNLTGYFNIGAATGGAKSTLLTINDTSGNVGIGTTTPDTTLHINHANQTTGSYENKGLMITESAESADGLVAYTRSSAEAYIGLNKDLSASNGYLIFGMNLDSVGNKVDALTIRQNGNIGIGTTSPSATDWNASSKLLHMYQNDTNGALIKLQSSNASAVFSVASDAAYLYTTTADPLVFGTNGSEKMRIDSSGNFTIGASSGASSVTIPGANSGAIIFYGAYSGSPASPGFVIQNQLGAVTMSHNSNGGSTGISGTLTVGSLISCGGIVTNGSGTMSCSSDETLKDIQGTYTNGLDSLRNINPIAYSWKQDSGMYDNGIVYYGFSAQNVQASLPQAVSTSSNNKLQISQLTLLASSINAIKELDIKVQSLPTFENPTLATKVAEFLSGIAEGVANIGRVNTDTLCVGNTCVTESQLQQLLQQASVGNNNSTPPPQETCSDGIMNQDETGIDEGGVCAPQVDPEPTPDPTCSDGILNQDETEIDIGGVCTPVEPTPEQTPPTP